MTTESLHDLLALLWPSVAARGAEAHGCDGERVKIVSAGRRDSLFPRRFVGAEALIEGVLCRGDIIIGTPPPGFAGAMLQVAATEAVQRMAEPSGLFVPRIVVEVPPAAIQTFGRLAAGAPYSACGDMIAALEPVYRTGMLTGLLVERLGRKTRDLQQIHSQSEGSWEQTFYVMLLRYMGGNTNREAFTELARRVTYAAITRERESLLRVEALLLGASGLLENYGTDEYVVRLLREFDYLARKHSVVPMSPGAWKISHINPRNHPVLRLAQAAAFLADREFLLTNMLKCATADDAARFFSAEASDYWTTHYTPSCASPPSPKRLGRAKAELLGINMISPMMFAYGEFSGNELLKEQAVALLEKTAPEDNTYIRAWARQGVVAENAFSSQALIQLRTEYCDKLRCTACPLGKRVIKKRTEEAM